jgi:hypothetical protein
MRAAAEIPTANLIFFSLKIIDKSKKYNEVKNIMMQSISSKKYNIAISLYFA